eukprot:Ihof_evm12s32 gene=Ihof_evmTU12s32
MPFTFHSHSGRYSTHGNGSLDEVVVRAKALGFISLGMSEHFPRNRDEQLYPNEVERGIRIEDLQAMFKDYVVEAKRCQRESIGMEMEVLVGMETEFLGPISISECQDLIATHSFDYVVASVHHVDGIPIDYSNDIYVTAEQKLGGTENVFLKYFEHQYDLIKGLQPPIIGHFDLIRMYRPDYPLSAKVWQQIERNIDLGVACGAIFEINS